MHLLRVIALALWWRFQPRACCDPIFMGAPPKWRNCWRYAKQAAR